MRVELKNVSKTFETSGLVLSDFSLQIPNGDFVTLLGPSGSGKSTVLRLIAELEKVTSGQLSVTKEKRFSIGYVFQESSLMPWRTVQENIELPLELSKSTRHQVPKILELVGLSEAASLYPHELSGGMKMRASIARSLVMEPDLLLLDEPFSALDENLRYNLALELRRIWLEKKITVVLVTHSIAEATFMSNRALILSKRPAHVASEIAIALPQERSLTLRMQSEYMRELQKVTDAYRNVHGAHA